MDVKFLEFKIFGDERGSLIALESNKNIPFDIERVYYIFGTKKGVRRGCHAHKNIRQIMICVSGSCKVLLDDGEEKMEILLNKPNIGLYIGNMVWREMYDFSEDCVIVVLADKYYDEADYIRSHEEFLKLKFGDRREKR